MIGYYSLKRGTAQAAAFLWPRAQGSPLERGEGCVLSA